MKLDLKKLTKKQIILISLSIVLTIVFIAGIIIFWPYIKMLQSEEYQQKFQDWVASFGTWGVFILILVQFLQIIFFFIPGELVEVSSGLLYGTFWGYIICTVGQILSILFVYLIFKIFGKKVIHKVVDEKTITDISEKAVKTEVVLFFYLLLPGLPKDILNFVAPYLNVPVTKFIIINVIARFPSVISSTLMGSSIIHGNFNFSLFIMILSGAIGLLGIIFNKQIVELVEKINKKHLNKDKNAE